MTYPLRKTCALALAMSLLAIVAGGCSSSSDGQEGSPGKAASGTHAAASKPQPRQDPNQVVIDNFTFNPRTLTISAGTMVTWVNHDDVPHTATSTAKPKSFDSSTLDTDDQFTHLFTTPGTYEYFCALHPKMTARIVVK